MMHNGRQASGPRRRKQNAALLIGICLCTMGAAFSTPGTGPEERATEHEVKAAYVYYFARFTEWPLESVSARNTPITIGIFGDDEFALLLEKVVRNKTVLEHPIVVRRLQWPQDLDFIQILYVDSAENGRLKQLSQETQRRSILTITDAEKDVQTAGIVSMYLDASKVQFDVDVTAAEKSRLRISSKLLRIARDLRGGRVAAGEGRK